MIDFENRQFGEIRLFQSVSFDHFSPHISNKKNIWKSEGGLFIPCTQTPSPYHDIKLKKDYRHITGPHFVNHKSASSLKHKLCD